MSKLDPFQILNERRGQDFQGEWPTLVEISKITVSRFPDKMAFQSFDPEPISFTYSEILKYFNQIAYHLHSIGIRKGDKVGVTGKNSPQWAIAYFAILYAGGIVVPIDYQLNDDLITGLLDKAGVKALFCGPERMDAIKGIVKKKYPIYSLSSKHDGYLLELSGKEVEIELPNADDLAAILFTSGTTGVAKGVMLTHSNLTSDAFIAQQNMYIYSHDIFYALLPLHHSYSMQAVMIEPIVSGSGIVFGSELVSSKIFSDLEKGKVTMFLGVPMLFNKMIKSILKGVKEKGFLTSAIVYFLLGLSGMLKRIFGGNPGKIFFKKSVLEKISMSTNRICISGGGPLPASTFRYFNQLGIDFVQGYGLTETSPIVALNPITGYVLESVGQVLKGIDVKILDPDGDGVGEIALKGPNIMKGYYEDEAATAEVFTEDGWFKTGDMGWVDKNRFLYLTGRAKLIIVTEGGKNVYPEEIEDQFQLFDEIEQIMVRGYVLDKEMKTEGIEAVIYPTEDFRGKPQSVFEDIVSQVNKNLMGYQKITKVTVTEEAMEMTTTKKIKRH